MEFTSYTPVKNTVTQSHTQTHRHKHTRALCVRCDSTPWYLQAAIYTHSVWRASMETCLYLWQCVFCQYNTQLHTLYVSLHESIDPRISLLSLWMNKTLFNWFTCCSTLVCTQTFAQMTRFPQTGRPTDCFSNATMRLLQRFRVSRGPIPMILIQSLLWFMTKHSLKGILQHLFIISLLPEFQTRR